VRFTFAAADAAAERRIEAELQRAFLPPYLGPLQDGSAGTGFTVARGAGVALDDADAAWIASGTAVLEAALREVPTVALYIVSQAQVRIARRIWKRPYITLPNLLLGHAAVPECLQDDATPERLADELAALLAAPAEALAELRAVRAALGDERALDRSAAFALELASV
jgi:lipid A disaccharide synthetase